MIIKIGMQGLLILRPLCLAASLIWCMEKCGMEVNVEERVKLLCVRYETALSMSMYTSLSFFNYAKD